MNRLIDIDFDIFVPSHFGYGNKQDLIDWRDMMEYSRQLARNALRQSGTPGIAASLQAGSGNQMGTYFDAVYPAMEERYGDWHGFNDMFILNLVRDIVGESLGY